MGELKGSVRSSFWGKSGEWIFVIEEMMFNEVEMSLIGGVKCQGQ